MVDKGERGSDAERELGQDIGNVNAITEAKMEVKDPNEDGETALNEEDCEESCSSDETGPKANLQEPVCKLKSASSDPNFGVVWSFVSKFGYLLNLPECSIDQIEAEFDTDRKLEKSTEKLGLLEQLHIKLLRRLSKSCDKSVSCLSQVSSERLERTLVKLAKALDLKLAWDLEHFGYHVLRKGEKLLLLKSLCELQFDENPNFRSHLNDEFIKNDKLHSLRLQPFGRDIEGRMIWYHEDKKFCFRVYSVEEDDADSVSWKVHASNSEELNDWIQYLKIKSEVNPKDVAFRKRQEKKQEERAKRKAEEELKKKGKGRGRKPKGKTNKSKAKETESSDDEDENPCARCYSNNRPELVLLCDKCDAAYHTLCLRPPLMVIPEGDWFCPFCEQEALIDKLAIKLKDLVNKRKAAERAAKRLDYCGIDLANIVAEESFQDASCGGRRSCRARKSIDYKFSQFDEAIHNAIVSVDSTEIVTKQKSTEPVSARTPENKAAPKVTRILSGKELIYGVDEEFESEESEPEEGKESDDESYKAAEDEDEFLNDPEEEEEEEEEQVESEESDFEEEVGRKKKQKPGRSLKRALRVHNARRRSKRFRRAGDSEEESAESDQSWEQFPRASRRNRTSVRQNYAEYEYSFDEDSEAEKKESRKAISFPRGQKIDDEDYNPKKTKQLWSDEDEEDGEEEEELEDEEDLEDIEDVEDEVLAQDGTDDKLERLERVIEEREDSMTSVSEDEPSARIKRRKVVVGAKRKVLDDSDETNSEEERLSSMIKCESNSPQQTTNEETSPWIVDRDTSSKVKQEETVCDGQVSNIRKDPKYDSVPEKEDETETKETKSEAISDQACKPESLQNDAGDHELACDSIKEVKKETDCKREVSVIDQTCELHTDEKACDIRLQEATKDKVKRESPKADIVNGTSTSQEKDMSEGADGKIDKLDVRETEDEKDFDEHQEDAVPSERKRGKKSQKNVNPKNERKTKSSVAGRQDKKSHVDGRNGDLFMDRLGLDPCSTLPSGFYDYPFGPRFPRGAMSSTIGHMEIGRQPYPCIRTPPCDTSENPRLFNPYFSSEFMLDPSKAPRGFSSVSEVRPLTTTNKSSSREHYPLSPDPRRAFYPRYPPPMPPFGPTMPYPRYPTSQQSPNRKSGCPPFPGPLQDMPRRSDFGSLPPPPQLLHFPSSSSSSGENPYTDSMRANRERSPFLAHSLSADVARQNAPPLNPTSLSEKPNFFELPASRGVEQRYGNMLSPDQSSSLGEIKRDPGSTKEIGGTESKKQESSKRHKIWSPYSDSQPTKINREKAKDDALKETSIVKNYTAFQSMVINPVASHGKTPKSR